MKSFVRKHRWNRPYGSFETLRMLRKIRTIKVHRDTTSKQKRKRNSIRLPPEHMYICTLCRSINARAEANNDCAGGPADPGTGSCDPGGVFYLNNSTRLPLLLTP